MRNAYSIGNSKRMREFILTEMLGIIRWRIVTGLPFYVISKHFDKIPKPMVPVRRDDPMRVIAGKF